MFQTMQQKTEEKTQMYLNFHYNWDYAGINIRGFKYVTK